jgi:hypothetical protein
MSIQDLLANKGIVVNTLLLAHENVRPEMETLFSFVCVGHECPLEMLYRTVNFHGAPIDLGLSVQEREWVETELSLRGIPMCILHHIPMVSSEGETFCWECYEQARYDAYMEDAYMGSDEQEHPEMCGCEDCQVRKEASHYAYHLSTIRFIEKNGIVLSSDDDDDPFAPFDGE